MQDIKQLHVLLVLEWVELLGPGNYSVAEGAELALVCRGSPHLSLGWIKLVSIMFA